jgi:FMN phosphatase YigB (HAD superfamily)
VDASTVFEGKRALLLDMNSTFMFGEDRFGDDEDFSVRYSASGGALPASEINRIVRATYTHLDVRYPNPVFRHGFPSLESAIRAVAGASIDDNEVERIAETFAYHELGHIPPAYAAALHRLGRRFVLAAVVDIWSPKQAWLDAFERAGIADAFSTLSFSSDHGMVKPSPIPFQRVLEQLGVCAAQAMVVGDSVHRDLGGATAAGIDCILVGGARDSRALAVFDNLLSLCESLGV